MSEVSSITTTTDNEGGGFTVEIKHYFSAEDISNIFCTAFESGAIHYWCSNAPMVKGAELRGKDPCKAEYYAPPGFEYDLYDAENDERFADGESEFVSHYRPLNIANLKLGMEAWLNENIVAGRPPDITDIDGVAVDQIIQYAVFGEPVFG